MNLTYKEIKELLKTLDYKEIKENKNLWFKKYEDYTIVVDFEKEKILYQDKNSNKKIELGDETTSNFENSENFVVLECVDRLLKKGYKPESITLEKKWEMGKKEKGKLDILVSQNNKSYLMIECKTWGKEFEKEHSNMLNRKGGQLFSYYNQDRNAEYLCLYTSRLNERKKVEFQNKIVKIDEEFRSLANVEEIYTRWNKQFSFNGIFEDGILPYGIKAKALLRKDLIPIYPDDSKKIYNHFLEILRHNVVSDKPNAFNKIFNLFVCKVFDEDNTKESEELKFQWVEGRDNEETFMDKLNILFKKGMNSYLKKDIFYITLDEIESENNEELKENLKLAMIYRNPEFSFVDIFDKRDFKRNTRIVKEVVELLQSYRFRYTEKHQFLGDFFENLLNTGFKQEVGQFFTPRILTRFIVQSLPIKEMIKEKIESGEDDFIPKVIDFACGSGHFLTESMDIIQKCLLQIGEENLNILPRIKNILDRYNKDADKFIWAKENIYGIENDYRLVKTTKLSCFFNGDGEAKILQTSGIHSFDNEEYRGTLLDCKSTDNEKFDILISNPPYAINGFKSIMDKNSNKAFSLYEGLSDSSSEIETIFVERMKQLIKPKGYGAIILPVSLLSNGGLYGKARKIIFENFYLKSIVKLGSNVFQATETNTVVLFLQKRDKSIILETKEDYIKLTSNSDRILIVDTGEKEAEKKFLGYSFSNRRGNEGITEERDGDNQYLGSLMDEKNRDNKDKVNYYILQSILNNYPNIPSELKNNIYFINLEDAFNFEVDNFENTISLSKKKRIISKYKLVTLSPYIVSITKGKSITKNKVNSGNIPVIAGGKVSPYSHSEYNQEANCITVSASGTAGYVWYHNYPIWASDCNVIRSLNEKENITKFVYYCMKEMQALIYDLKKGANQPHVYKKDLENFKIPLPPIEKQKGIVSLMEEQENIISKEEKIIEEENNKINSFDFSGHKLIKLKEIISLLYGVSLPERNRIDGEYPVYGSDGIIGYHNNFLVKAPNIIIGRKGSAGEINFATKNFTPIDTTFYIKPLTDFNFKYIFYILKSMNLKQYKTGLGSGGINRTFILNLNVHYTHSTEEQNKIVSQLEIHEQKIEQSKDKITKAKEKQKEIINDIIQIY